MEEKRNEEAELQAYVTDMYVEIIADVRAAFRITPLLAAGVAVAEVGGPRLHWGNVAQWLQDDSDLLIALGKMRDVRAVPFSLAIVGLAESTPPLEQEFYRFNRDGLAVAANWLWPSVRSILPPDAEAKAKAMVRHFLDACLSERNN